MGQSSASAPAQDGGRSFVLLLSYANRERLAGVQGAAMSPLVAGTRPAKSWQDAPLPRSLGRRLHHLMIELSNPAVGHRAHHHAPAFAAPTQPGPPFRPTRV